MKRTNFYIGILGRWKDESIEVLSLCEQIGERIASYGAVLVCGGSPGAVEAACKGAKTAGGITLGILPSNNKEEANRYVDLVIPTGLGYEVRSALVIRASDALILVGGGNGSLGELSMAYLNKKPVVVLSGSGGWADRIQKVMINGHYLDERNNVPIISTYSPFECVQMAIELAQKSRTGRS